MHINDVDPIFPLKNTTVLFKEHIHSFPIKMFFIKVMSMSSSCLFMRMMCLRFCEEHKQ